MQGKHILLMLVHLFRKCGNLVELDDAVYHLAFTWRYGSPTRIRRLLEVAKDNDLISMSGQSIKAEFLYDTQELSPNQADILRKHSSTSGAT